MLSYLRYSVSLRPSCYACRYKGTDRYSDSRWATSWGIGKKVPDLDADQGTSLVICEHAKGQRAFDSVRQQIRCCTCSMEDVQKEICAEQIAGPGEIQRPVFQGFGESKPFILSSIYCRYILRRKLEYGDGPAVSQ
jgi:hypothetical protein